MYKERVPCEICSKPTTEFNYGVICCNACKMFYRRAKLATNFPKECQNPGNCKGCRFCRFQRCLQAGLSREIVAPPRQLNSTLGAVVENLKALDIYRKDQFLKYTPLGDLSIEELILTDTSNLIKKPDDFQQGNHQWIMTNHITSVNALKKFTFFKDLSDTEKMLFVTQSHIAYGMLTFAMRSFTNRSLRNEYPGGIDIFSNELKNFYRNSPKSLNECRGQVLRKLWELNIRDEEFLLLCAIIACNPGPSNFSDFTRALLSRHQNEYASILMKFCQQTYQSASPARFMEIVCVRLTINKAFEDLKKVVIPFQLSKPKFEKAKILEESLETLMK